MIGSVGFQEQRDVLMELKMNTQLKKYNSDKFVSDNQRMPALSKHKAK